MSVNLELALSDAYLPENSVSQRQLAISVSASPEASGGRNVPLNLGLILDHSGSMAGQALERVKRAAQSLVDRLHPDDRLTVVVFDHIPKVLIKHQAVDNPIAIKQQIARLTPQGGTAIDKGMKLGIDILSDHADGMISQAFLLTDGENEHGSNQRCLDLARQAASENITINTFGFGYHWNPDVLEQIADAAGGSLTFVEFPEDAITAFNRQFNRVISIGLTNAYLRFNLFPGVRLADFKPIAQVEPEVIELPLQTQGHWFAVRIGDLLIDQPRRLLANLYIDPLPRGTHPIVCVQVCYDDPAQQRRELQTPLIPVSVTVDAQHPSQPDPRVHQQILALAKYRQTQIAETKLHAGDRMGAANMLSVAAQTALQMGDRPAATLLQDNATRLQEGKDLSEGDRKKTRLAAKITTIPNSSLPPSP